MRRSDERPRPVLVSAQTRLVCGRLESRQRELRGGSVDHTACKSGLTPMAGVRNGGMLPLVR